MAIVIWTNIMVGIILVYTFIRLKTSEKQTVGTKFKIFLVVVAIAGLIATFGENLIYLLTSGAIAFAVLGKDRKDNEHIKLDS